MGQALNQAVRIPKARRHGHFPKKAHSIARRLPK